MKPRSLMKMLNYFGLARCLTLYSDFTVIHKLLVLHYYIIILDKCCTIVLYFNLHYLARLDTDTNIVCSRQPLCSSVFHYVLVFTNKKDVSRSFTSFSKPCRLNVSCAKASFPWLTEM